MKYDIQFTNQFKKDLSVFASEKQNDTTAAALEEGRKMMKKYKKYLQCTCE